MNFRESVESHDYYRKGNMQGTLIYKVHTPKNLRISQNVELSPKYPRNL